MNNWKNIKSIGLGIVCFDASEHLANIITEVRDVIDYVVIGVQKVSYFNQPIDPVDVAEIEKLKKDGLIDEIKYVELDLNKHPRDQETDKRNMLLEAIKEHGCSHALVIDSDEFYPHNSFVNALNYIDDKNYDVTYCRYVNYYHDYKHFLVYPNFGQGMFVPFVSKIKYNFKFQQKSIVATDPTRRYELETYKIRDKSTGIENDVYTANIGILSWDLVKMHHLSWIRADIRKKLNSWSSKTLFNNYLDIIDKAVETYESFDETADDQSKVTVMFNTPDQQMFVKAFPKQYIYPKYDYRKRLTHIKRYKKTLILNLSSTNSKCDLFNTLEKTCRNTWAKRVLDNEYDNIDYYSVIDTDKETYVDHESHTVYVQTDTARENIYQLLDRFIIAYELLSKETKYEYVIRTNTSTWCNIDLLNEVIAHTTDETLVYSFGLMSAFWSLFNIFCSGACLIYSHRNMLILETLFKAYPKNILDRGYDDVMMSALLRDRMVNLGISNPDKYFVSLEGKYLPDLYGDTNFKNINFAYPLYQVKTFNTSEDSRSANDVIKMETINNMWEEIRGDKNFDKMAKILLNSKINKTVNIIPYGKIEWQTKVPENIKDTERFRHAMPYDSKAFDLIKKLKIQHGYTK